MKKFLGAVSALALFAAVGVANAEEATGTVSTIDETTNMLTLEDGTQYMLGEGVSTEGLAPGTEVTVTFEEQDGQRTATQVQPAAQ